MTAARIAPVLAAVLLAQLAIAAFPTPAHLPSATVGFRSAAYTPATVRVFPGGTVTWAPEAGSSFDAQDPAGHPLHFLDPSIGDQTSGNAAVTRTFASPGRYRFVCLHHAAAGMTGTVVVTSNHEPVASFVAPASAPQGTPVTLDASSSFDEDPSQTLTYSWDFDGDGTFDQTTSASAVSHVFATPGKPIVRLRVTDSNADAIGPEWSEMSQPIDVTAAPSGVPPSGRSGDEKPAVTFAVRLPVRRQPLRQVARRGLVVRASSSGAGLAEATLQRGSRTIGRGSAGFVAPGTRSLTIRLSRTGRSALARVRRITLRLVVVLTDEAGGETRVTRKLTLRR